MTSTMKRLIFCAVAAMMMLLSCSPEPIAFSGKDVNIDIQVNKVSSGFIKVKYKLNRSAFYLAKIEKAVPGVNPDDIAQRFMELALDSAYVAYVQWRHNYLVANEQYVADFTSHMLEYGDTEETRTFLTPDTDYWVFAFPVNKATTRPDGKLFWKLVHTPVDSKCTSIRFAYRVRGLWDYIYPYDTETNQLEINVPWGGMTADSLEIVESGAVNPGAFFMDRFDKMDSRSLQIHSGVYSHWNNGEGDGSSKTIFLPGHVYYSAMSVLDGQLTEAFDIYKFKYTDENLELQFTDEDSTLGDW